MNGLIKGTFIFVLGAGAGALGSAYFFMKRAEKACKAYEQQCREDYEALSAQRVQDSYSSSNQEKSSEEKFETKSEPQPMRKREPVDYTRYSKPDVNDVIRRAEEKLAEEEKPMEEDDHAVRLSGPKVIRANEYGQNRSLDPEDLYYFTEDDVLCTEDKEEIDEDAIPYMIGDALDESDYRNSVTKFQYVKNEKRGKYYRIEKIIGAFGNG